MADDMGYESLSCYEKSVYHTPVLDSLAASGIRFTNCVSQPLCTPSRVKLMTGRYNYRNYDFFGHLNQGEYSIGNLMQDAGYATCIAGKWQLNGLAYPDQIPYGADANRPHDFGFEEYCLWQLTQARKQGERYAEPLVEQNGELVQGSADDYGPDLFSNFILDFIERKQAQPFFVYYPMVLVHDPFVPTPDSDGWEDPALRYQKDTTYYKDMVAYTDKIVGQIVNQLKALNLDEQTLLIFTGDNGTHPSIYSYTGNGLIRGDKGNTTDAGTHVPLIVSWPENLSTGSVFEGLIEFSDFFPTLAALVGKEAVSDGKSFLPLLKGESYEARETAFVHYDPRWGNRVNQYRNQFVRTLGYKLYQDGQLFDLEADRLEERPLAIDSLSPEVAAIYARLQAELAKHPPFPEAP
jgi:arylsulfatase A